MAKISAAQISTEYSYNENSYLENPSLLSEIDLLQL